MTCAFGAVPPGSVTRCSMSRTVAAVFGESTRTPDTAGLGAGPRGRVSVTGISSPSWANTV